MKFDSDEQVLKRMATPINKIWGLSTDIIKNRAIHQRKEV